ncbi:hypothetical protein ACWGST_10060 [Agromyces sp. NPDC055520]
MNDDNDRDPIARLRAADPAAGVEARAGFTDDVLAQTTASNADTSSASNVNASNANTPTPDPSNTSEATAEVADLTVERARRRPRWVPIAAVAASLAVVGGVGFGLGSVTGGADLASGAASPITLQAGSPLNGQAQNGAQNGAMNGALEGSQAFAADGKMAAPGTSSLMYPYGFGRNSFSASGLATAESRAPAYAYDARAASNTETVAALAGALGVEGAPVLQNGGWTVGPQDGTGATLYVGLDGTLGFSYSDSRINPWMCTATVEPVPAVPDATTDGPTIMPGVPMCETPTADIPSEGAAIDAMRSIITAAGRDADAFEYASETWEGAVTRTAQAWPVVDGQRIDQSWSVELTNEGIVNAYGTLADLVTLGQYDVVSEQEGFERLSDPRFGAQMTAMPFAAADVRADAMVEEWVPPTEPPATPTKGSAVSWPVNDVKIVSARLGLSTQWQPDGSVVVVPAYEFTDANGGTWSVIAVADTMLDFATE